jgi:hypothetical protein
VLAVNGPSATQFAWLRVALGCYLAAAFGAWIPHAELLLQARSLVPLPETPFPNALGWVPDAASLRAILAGLCAVGLVYAAGLWRRPLAIFLWYAWACLVGQVFIVMIPSDGYVGWLLLASALVPAGEGLHGRHSPPGWCVPSELVILAWIIAAVSYTASGLDKLGSATWRHGDALGIVLASPIARPSGAMLVQAVPEGWWQLATWSALALECGYGVLCVFGRTRRWAWLVAVVMHVGVLAFLQLASVSFAMLIFHGFLFDPAWLPVSARRSLRVRFTRHRILSVTLHPPPDVGIQPGSP